MSDLLAQDEAPLTRLLAESTVLADGVFSRLSLASLCRLRRCSTGVCLATMPAHDAVVCGDEDESDGCLAPAGLCTQTASSS